MWINGTSYAGASRERINVINPATEEVIDTVARGTAADAVAAVDAAAGAFPAWRTSSATDRAAFLRGIADKLAERRDEFAALLLGEQGKPIGENISELDDAIELFHYYAGFAWQDRGSINQSSPDFLDFVQREPVGVVACIVPWNFPIMLMARKVAAALAAGNTVVVKPSEETPLATLLFAREVADHLPPGVVNVVTGYGREVGEPLVNDPRVRHIAFTGSTATGQALAVIAASQMKGTTLELGGKDPLIAGPDVDIDRVVPLVASAALYNAGQCCTSSERVYVHSSIIGAFTDALVEHVRTIRVGDAATRDVGMGPLIRDDARVRVRDQVNEAVVAGARVLTGGRVPTDSSRGWFYEPTVIVDVPNTARLLTEETFGPVLPVAAFDTVDQAVEFANETKYGLGASVLSNDPVFVKRCIDGLEVGNVFVNDPLTATTVSTFGGRKMSGIGRELGTAGYEAFQEAKHVHWKLSV